MAHYKDLIASVIEMNTMMRRLSSNAKFIDENFSTILAITHDDQNRMNYPDALADMLSALNNLNRADYTKMHPSNAFIEQINLMNALHKAIYNIAYNVRWYGHRGADIDEMTTYTTICKMLDTMRPI